MSTPVKVALAIGGILLIVLNSQWLALMAVFLGAVYLIYFGIRAIMMGSQRSQPRPAPNATPNPPQARPQRRRTRRHRHPRASWREQARKSLHAKPASQRFAELTGSFLMAAIVCAVISLIVLVTGGRELDSSVHTWTTYAWLTVTSIVGSWLVLGMAKLWEGTSGDEVLRRFLMMVAGLLIGVTALTAGQLLMIDFSTGEMSNVLELPKDVIPRDLYAADGITPLPTAFLAYFATLFLVLRWWKQVDPLRRTRFSLWAAILCTLVAMLIPWQLPWGFLLALTISVAVQLASPWMNSSERSRIRRETLDTASA